MIGQAFIGALYPLGALYSKKDSNHRKNWVRWQEWWSKQIWPTVEDWKAIAVCRISSMVEHWNRFFQETFEAPVNNRADRILSGVTENLAFAKEEGKKLKPKHEASLSYQRKLLELHEMLRINPHLEINFRYKKSWNFFFRILFWKNKPLRSTGKCGRRVFPLEYCFKENTTFLQHILL